MNSNIHNGGVAFESGNGLFLADLRGYSGTFRRDEAAGVTELLDGVFWFMNEAEDAIYCSDQTRGNRLCRLGRGSQAPEPLLDRPVYGLTRQGEWLYYIGENDRKLYRCLLNGRSEARVADDAVEAFVVEANRIYYATEQGIRSCGLDGGDRELVSEHIAVQLITLGERLVFADKKNQHLLTVLYPPTGQSSVYDDIAPNSLNSDGRYLYCANRLNESSIYRIDPDTGSRIRICGERADYLHVLRDTLYFCSRQEWYRMSLSGGQAVKVITLS
ncbi:hypothetical protein J25TS5_28160 [Paenibacillus faecis]|uniref:DUF5050 domain-containing protein n=1 Tax=Paenibacillus faecis TaxID=862114 RepID=UPI001B25A467|nr:DUF5050 domain-containing protein [Paenibacillus faecis]GIO85884.1 hypothetical protein J25TS5_28160 [Paenibacillus faecis]